MRWLVDLSHYMERWVEDYFLEKAVIRETLIRGGIFRGKGRETLMPLSA